MRHLFILFTALTGIGSAFAVILTPLFVMDMNQANLVMAALSLLAVPSFLFCIIAASEG